MHNGRQTSEDRSPTSISRRSFIRSGAAVGITPLLGGISSLQEAGGTNDLPPTRITVRIENVSTPETLDVAGGDSQAVLLSPGVYVVHSDLAPIFTPGLSDRGDGLEALAEDGDPTELARSLGEREGITETGTFTTPVDANSPGPIGPEEVYEFTVTALPHQHLSFVTMFVASNDLFYAPNESGLPLFDDTGKAAGKNINENRDIHLWDAGTEQNEPPGAGPNQPERQSGTDTGPSEAKPIVPVEETCGYRRYNYPSTRDVFNVNLAAERIIYSERNVTEAANETDGNTSTRRDSRR